MTCPCGSASPVNYGDRIDDERSEMFATPTHAAQVAEDGHQFRAACACAWVSIAATPWFDVAMAFARAHVRAQQAGPRIEVAS